jgi:hypothetical protein
MLREQRGESFKKMDVLDRNFHFITAKYKVRGGNLYFVAANYKFTPGTCISSPPITSSRDVTRVTPVSAA